MAETNGQIGGAGESGSGGAGSAGGWKGNGGGRFGGRDSRDNGQELLERRSALGKMFDRVPPHSLEAEMGLLGSMILDPRVVADVISIIKHDAAFYLPSHGRIFTAITRMVDSKGTVDPLLLLEKLRDEGVLEQCGGADYIEKLAIEVPSAINAPFFAGIVSDKFKLRRLIDAAGTILHETYHAQVTESGEVKRLIDAAEQAIFNIAQTESISDIRSMEQLLVEEMQRLIAIEEGKIVETGVMTGFHELDRDTTGFHGGEMLILAARPSMGKTALVLNMAEQIALGTDTPGSSSGVRPRVPIGIFSLEMSRESLVQRLLSSWSGVSSQKIRSGQLSRSRMNDEHAALVHAANALSAAPLYIDDTPGLTLMGLRARARRMVRQMGVKVILIDYLQLLSSPQGARESRQAEVGQISRGIKELARELGIPIVALSQLNRNSEGREGNRPRISDLRESGSIEQDADVVMLLHREEYYHIGDEQWRNDPNNADKIGTAELIIAKQRNGPTGTVRLTWESTTTRFKNYADAGGYGYGGGGGSGGGGGGGTYDDRASGYGPAAGGSAQSGAPSGTTGSGFHPGRRTGPIDGHRDGGGPEQDEGEVAPF